MAATLPGRAFGLLCAALGLYPLANALTSGSAVPWWPLAAREWLVRGIVVGALAALLAILLGTRADALFARTKTWLLRPSPRTFAVAASAFAVVAAAGLAWYCFSARPFTSDEMAQQWHARILLSGRLAAASEPLREFFNTAPVLDANGRWFSQYPVGGPAFIALGMLFGGAWIVNPLLLGVATWKLYQFFAHASSETTARLATLLFVSSPMVLVMAASQMNHLPALALTAIALTALARWDAAVERAAWRRQAVVMGLAIGATATVRPLDAAVVALVIGSFQLWRSIREPGRWTSLLMQIAAGAIPVAFLLWANASTTGSPVLFGYDALNGPEHGIGFHVDPNGELHTPLRGLTLASGYLMRLSRYLFEWPIPAMLPILAGLLLPGKPTRWDGLLLALAACVLAAYGAYWFDGFFSGPRFLFTALPAFIYFATRGVMAAGLPRNHLARRTLLFIVPLCILATWAGPEGVSSARGTIALYREQRTKLKTDIEAQVRRARLTNALVFVNEGWRGRLLARLRVLGASQFRAERLVNTLDACALGDALDDAARLPARAPGELLDLVVRRARAHGDARLVPDLPADQAVAIVPGSVPSRQCIAEFQSDSAGTIPYPPFLTLHSIENEGRIAGEVIFARDLGNRNELLRGRFGDRAWYRYRPARGLDDARDVFVPYARPTDE